MLAPLITNHVETALSRFLQQYKGKSGLAGLMTALVDQIQDLEDATFALNETRQFFNGTTFPAVGAQLDGLGEIIGLQRNGLSDMEYLVLLQGKIGEDYSDGTQQAVVNVIKTVYQASLVWIKTPNTPGIPGAEASLAYGVGDPQADPSLYALIQTLVANTIAAGVGLYYISTFDAENAFAMDGPQPGGGFGDDLNPSVGGKFATDIFTSSTL